MSEKKPSLLVNLTLVIILLIPVAGVGWGGWWAYNKFFAGDKGSPELAANTDDSDTKIGEEDPATAEEKAKRRRELEKKFETPVDKPADESTSGGGSDPEGGPGKSTTGGTEKDGDTKADSGTKIVDASGKGSAATGNKSGDTTAGTDGGNTVVFSPPDTKVADPKKSTDIPLTDAGTGSSSGDSGGSKEGGVGNSPKDPKSTTDTVGGSDPDKALPKRPPVAEEMAVFGAGDKEAEDLRKDAIARIDEAPSDLYDDRRKHLVKTGITNAQGIVRICTVYFTISKDSLSSSEATRLKEALGNPELKSLSSNPKAVFFVLGFADPSGSVDFNKKLSMTRAQAVVDLLKGEHNVRNMVHPVAIGPTEIISDTNKEKNRAAEIWGVFP